jgi:hydrogenase/urease accessory protein HupE
MACAASMDSYAIGFAVAAVRVHDQGLIAGQLEHDLAAQVVVRTYSLPVSASAR